MPDYQKGKIYKLYSPSKNLVYYGSTIQSLSQRLGEHISHCKTYNNDNNKAYCSSYLIIDCEDYKIELLEEYPCNNKSQLNKKEGEYIKENECVNKVIAGRTDKEWRSDNKKDLAEAQKKWYQEHKEEQKKYKEEYNIKNADKVKEYQKQYNQTEKRKESEKLRYQNEERKQYKRNYMKEYRLKQKEQVKLLNK
jgi:hypothetical protein